MEPTVSKMRRCIDNIEYKFLNTNFILHMLKIKVFYKLFTSDCPYVRWLFNRKPIWNIWRMSLSDIMNPQPTQNVPLLSPINK